MIKSLHRRLEALDLHGQRWQKQIVTITLALNDQVVEYQGHALASEPAAAQSIDFQFKTTPLRSSKISIPLLVSSNASVILHLNDDLVDTLELPASGAKPSLIRWIHLDVTKWAESREVSKLQLIISYHGEYATTTIPLGMNQPELQPQVLQQWSWRYGLQSISFFALAWSSIIALAILILAHIQPLGDTFRFYAVLLAVATWIAGAIGLPDVARIPLRPMLRRLYSKTRSSSAEASLVNRRRVWLASLSLFFILVCSGAGVVIYCLIIRQYYSSLIHRALEESNNPDARDIEIRKALSLLPWRREAQMLFESVAYQKRNGEDMGGFRAYISKFAKDPDVKQAMRKATDIDHLPFCLTKSTSTAFLSDPVVWYTSTIIEGEDFNETSLMNEAITILAARRDALAQIQLGNLRLYLALISKPDFNKVDNAASNLREQLEQNYDLRGTHVYQAACDTLACYYLSICVRDQASKWFEEELSARKNQSALNREPLWLRPPEKLILFYMFASHWNMKGVGVSRALCILEPRDCNPKLKEDESCDFRSIFEERLWTPNPDYHTQADWTKNTMRDESLKLDLILEDSLKKGWRY